MNVDHLIIGQGLAGSLLGWRLIQAGRRIVIIDPAKENASRIAGGLINPITGMRFVKNQNAEVCLSHAKRLYQDLESTFNTPFFLKKKLLRFFKNAEEKTAFNKRKNDPAYQPFFNHVTQDNTQIADFSCPFGAIEQHQTGQVLTARLLAQLQQFFINHNSYIKTQLHYSNLIVKNDSIQWRNISAQNIIFCEGYHGAQNPWFSWLPFQPAKGEILTLKSTISLPKEIISYGSWLIPEPESTFKIGATFDAKNIDCRPTVAGKNNLTRAFEKINPRLGSAELVAHRAQIRPCTLDKQPFIGYHPQHQRLFIFNGFGAKGCLEIPWYSLLFYKHLTTQSASIPSQANINRIYDSHFTG
ncbi:MAG: FAD-binding oxidoreductase [Methylococcales bacterium]|nr:FAD-binding oxidoreductase [Methylococcales bacterium]